MDPAAHRISGAFRVAFLGALAYSVRCIASRDARDDHREDRIARERQRRCSKRNLAYVKQILLADDSAVVRRSMRRMFEQAGWTVCGEASDGEEAVAMAQELKPDVIVLDLSMPLMNGLTAARVLKKILPETPLILFTSFGNLLSAADLELAGFAASISKSDAGKLVTTAQRLTNVH